MNHYKHMTSSTFLIPIWQSKDCTLELTYPYWKGLYFLLFETSSSDVEEKTYIQTLQSLSGFNSQLNRESTLS